MTGKGQEPLESPLVAGVRHTVVAFDALYSNLLGGQTVVPPEVEDVSCPLFVSWHKRSRSSGDSPRLRGCIGTLEPRPLRTALPEYALTSALRDRRFPPIEARELPRLRCTVSLLTCFEAAAGWEDWEIGKHGLVIEFLDPHTGGRRTATFLPEVAAHEGWDKQQTIDHLIRKAGYAGAVTKVRAALKVTRYQSSAVSLWHEEYAKLREGHIHSEAVGGGQHSSLVAVSAAQ